MADGDKVPVYSPDGARVAFVSLRNGKPQIFLLDLRDLSQRSLTGDDSNTYDPAWSPDGKKIAFVSDKDGQPFQIYVMSLDSQRIQRISDGESADGHPSWSPDGRLIVFDAAREGDDHVRQIYRMNADGTKQITKLTRGSGVKQTPSWSPRPCERPTR
jgi:TolB protein